MNNEGWIVAIVMALMLCAGLIGDGIGKNQTVKALEIGCSKVGAFIIKDEVYECKKKEDEEK